VAMHVVLGDGEMSRKELTETLKDLWTRAGDDQFWFVVQGKSAPTETDANLVNWLAKNEIWFEVITDDADATDEIYADAQETYVVKRLGQKVVSLLNTKPEEGESADLLGLFVSDDPAAEEDRWLNNIVQVVMEAGFPAYGLNDGLVEIDLGGDGATAAATEDEEEDEVPTPTKKPAKKVAAAASANGAKPKTKGYTRDELEDMKLDDLKEIAEGMGFTLPPRTRMATYIDRILGEGKDDTPAVEVSTPPVTKTVEDGEVEEFEGVVEGFDIEDIVDKVIERLIQALQE